MTPPEHVRCKNCCYYFRTRDERFGQCCRYPAVPIQSELAVRIKRAENQPRMESYEWCGEFRKEWPDEQAS